MKHMMTRKKFLISCCCFGVLLIIAALFLWSQGPYVYHPAKTRADLHDKPDKNPKLIHGFFSTKPTPDGIYYRNKVIVLMYHDVSATPMNDKSLNVTVFQKQLESMKNNNFHWITMEQYTNFITKRAPVPNNAVLMTFDDGYESFFKDAFPLLQKYHVPATNFLIVSTIGNPNHIGVKKLNWDEVKTMHKQGIDFYNHTYDSHKYDRVLIAGKRKSMLAPVLMGRIDDPKYNRHESEQQYEKRITTDLDRANQILYKEVGNTRHIVAFPYGGFSKPLMDVCKKLGIQVTFTVKKGINGPNDSNGYRVNAGGADNDPDVLIEYMKRGVTTINMSNVLK